MILICICCCFYRVDSNEKKIGTFLWELTTESIHLLLNHGVMSEEAPQGAWFLYSGTVVAVSNV